MDDDALEQQALDEILKETKKSAERAKEMGALGWTKCPLPSTNKTFLKNMLVSTLRNINSPKSRHRARGRENYNSHRDYRESRKRRHSDYDDDRYYYDVDSYSKREGHSSHTRNHTSDNAAKKHKKAKKSKREGKSDKHKSKHSKSKKSKKSKHKSKKKEENKVKDDNV